MTFHASDLRVSLFNNFTSDFRALLSFEILLIFIGFSLTWDLSLQNFDLTLLKIHVGGADVGSVLGSCLLALPLHLHHQQCEHQKTDFDLEIFLPDNLLLSSELPATGTVLICWELVQLSPLLWLFSNSGKLRFWLTMHHRNRQHRRLRIRGRKQLWTAKISLISVLIFQYFKTKTQCDQI